MYCAGRTKITTDVLFRFVAIRFEFFFFGENTRGACVAGELDRHRPRVPPTGRDGHGPHARAANTPTAADARLSKYRAR